MSVTKQTQPQAGRSPVAANGGDLIRVVIQSPTIWEPSDLSRQLSARQGFVLLRRTGSLDSVLSDCEKMAPCVLIVDQVLVETEGLDLDHFGTRVDYGRSIQVLVVGPKRDPGLVEDLLRMGCVGFLNRGYDAGRSKKAVKAVAPGEILGRPPGHFKDRPAVVVAVGLA